MSQWGRPRHAGVRHNQRVRGHGTWSEQDQRLRRHKKVKIRAQRGDGTWSEEDQRLSRRKKATALADYCRPMSIAWSGELLIDLLLP